MTEIGTTGLGEALNFCARTVRNAVERGDKRLSGYTRTPGGQLRWSVERAAAIVRAFGKVPPKEWEER